MDDIQSWSEVPSIAHFCSLFRAAFNLLDFDIEELEEALLTDGAEDSGSSLLQELIVRLLCGCIQNSEISTFNYQMFLRRLFRQKCHEYGRENPFNTDIDFQFLPLRTKVEILHALCDFRLDADDVQDLLKNLESDSLRVEPLGHDENKSAYWYFYGTRLYREDFPKIRKKIREKRRKSKEDKRKKKKGKISYESDIEDDIAPGVWQVVCFTEEDWEKLALKFKGSTCKDEKELHRTLTEDFLPEIPRLFAEKERLQRKRLMEYQPRRQSSRLEKLKQKEEEEKILAREEEEKLRLEKEERERRERLMARAVRAFHRGSSRSGSECGSYRSERDKDLYESTPLSEEKDKDKDKEKEKEKEKNRLAVGRQTNNSLASATGQIIIQPPRRKKLRSKQVFKTSAEDLRTGMYKILDFIKNHDEAWPFVDPVDENYAPRYYSVIRKPMDLQRMEEKLDNGEYTTFNDFKNDFQLIVDNCRQYNGSENEYTEMVRNLQDAFQDAVDRYLESDPSSDEEIAVEFPPTFEEQKVREHGKKKRKLKRKDKDQSKDKENKKKKYESDDSDSKPPSLKPQRIRSPLSEKSGSIPGSDFDDREPDFLREHSPPQLVKATDLDLAEDSSSDSRSKIINSKVKTEKPKKGTGVIKNVAAIEALSLATEQTLKDINKWLDDTPRFSEFSSASNSPSHFLSSEEFETVGNRIETDYKKSLKMEKPFRTKDKDGATKKRKNVDANKHPKRKEVQRTIERLQPGKSKGNLITNLPKAKENVEESGVTIGLGLGKLVKESRNALLVKTDETAPKLSLGTVLKSDIIGFGKSKHNFDEKDVVKKVENAEESTEKSQDDVKPKTNSLSFDYNVKDLPDKPDVKNEEYSKDKENDYAEKAKDEEVKTEVYEEKKRVAVKEITNKNKPTPNLSAWFKAFGAPKAPSTPRRKPELNDPPPTPGRAISPLQESRSELAFKDGKDKDKAWYNETFKHSPNNRIEAPPSVESEEPKSVSVASPMPSPDIRPGSASSLGQNLPPAPRQRKASTSSSMSERSSFSQDPMDGSSPHLSMDERLGGYPGPYPSPLHRSPVAASPVLASPKGDDINKSTYASINGTIRVGFYQDTSSNLQKSSPEKQSPNSNSPRDQGNSSPFQSYPSHVYPPTVSQGNMPNVYVQATHSTTNPYSTYPTATSASTYENLSQYSLPSMVNYPDQYRTAKPQENYNYTRPVYGNQEPTTAKPPTNIFPVKKRVYAEIESGRLQIPNETPKIQGNVQASSQSDSTNRNTYTDTFSRDMHLQQAQQYERYQQQQQQQQQPPPRLNYQTPDSGNRVVQSHEEPKDTSLPSQPLSFTMDQSKSQSDLSRIHAEISRLQLPADYSKLQQVDPNDMNAKSKYGPIDNLGRLQQQTMMPNPGNANRGGYPNPMEAASLGRLIPPSNSTITEDNDGVFRNKYENVGKLQPTQGNYPVQEEAKRAYGSPPSVMTRLQGNVSTADSRTPCSVSYQTPMDASIRQNLSNLSHIVDRYQAEERLMQQSPYYSDKNLANIYSKNVPACGGMYPQKVPSNQPGDSQVGYNRDAELNIPKPSSFVDPKKSRKKQSKTAEVVPTSTNGSGSTAFQQYVGLKSTEPSAISLKTASVVPGSAFNFGPAPTGLGLSNSLYSEKDAYSGLFEDFRSQPSSYYSMVAAAAHHRSTPDPSSEKTSHASGSSNTFPFLGHPQARTSSYPTLPQFVNPHQASLMDPATASSPLYQQYIQRLQEEQLRHSGVLHHQGLLGPSSGYPPGYHPALGIPRQSYDRPSWL